MRVHIPSLVVTATIMTMGCSSAAGETPYKITTKREDDQVKVKVAEGKAIISVCSPFGISQAVIEGSRNKWPDVVMLRLHLKGLENLKIVTGKITIEAAVSSQDGKTRLWKDGKEDSPLDAQSPCWMTIRRVGMEGEIVTAIPLKDGSFEMQLPKALLEDNPKSITLHWIDFYR